MFAAVSMAIDFVIAVVLLLHVLHVCRLRPTAAGGVKTEAPIEASIEASIGYPLSESIPCRSIGE